MMCPRGAEGRRDSQHGLCLRSLGFMDPNLSAVCRHCDQYLSQIWLRPTQLKVT